MIRSFEKIALLAPATINGIADILTDLVRFLHSQQRDIVCETNTANLLETRDVNTVSHEELGKNSDLIIVVGGDGSILRAAKNAARYQTPILGINSGKLGFLTDVRPLDMAVSLTKILQGEFWTSQRFLLQIHTDNHHHGVALNDCILSSSYIPHMIELELHVDKEFVCSHRADGLIIATPTGSTAYALSGGGPILHPKIDGLVILPIFSHSLTSRPIVVPGNSTVSIQLSLHHHSAAHISCDGEDILGTVVPGSQVHITKHRHNICLIHPLEYDFYQSLRSKLHWGKALM